jgi:hypothetical protein
VWYQQLVGEPSMSPLGSTGLGCALMLGWMLRPWRFGATPSGDGAMS